MSTSDKKNDKDREKKSSGYFNTDSYYKSRYSSGSSSYYSNSSYGYDDEDEGDYLDKYYQSRRKEYRSTWYGEERYWTWKSSNPTSTTSTSTTRSPSWGKTSSSYYAPRETMSSLIGSFGRSYYGPTISSDKKEQINRIMDSSIKLTKEFISILDLPFKVNISFDKSDLNLSTDVRNIYIPTKIFDYIEKLSLTDEQVINTTVGLGIHEAAHILYSSALLYKNVLLSEYSYRKVLFDLIEDERVEDCLLKERPGYSDFIKYAREYKISDAKNGIVMLKSKSCYNDYEKFFNVFVNVIYTLRYPSLIDKDVVKDNLEFFNKINKEIDETKLNNSKDSLSLANELEKIITTTFDASNNSSVKDILSSKEFFLNYGTPLMYGNDADLTGGETYYPEFEKILERLSSNLIKDGDIKISTKVSLGICELGENKTVFYKDSKERKELYLKIARDVSKYVPCIKKKILDVDKNTTINIYGCRQGLLDTTKIAEAIQGVPQVYYRSCEVKTSKVAVGVLVDESGSMSGDRIDRAREAAILLNETLGSIPGVELFIYGHSADQHRSGNTEITVYREPGYNNKYALASISDKYENRDGIAILETAKRIRKFTKTPTLLFVISDGSPSARDYRGEEAIIDTGKKVRLVESTMGMSIVQITISDFYNDYCSRYVKEMFSKSVHLEDNLDDLAIELGKVLRNAVIENKETSMTF